MISFKLFAGTDVGLRDNNEDNFTVCPDLSQNEWIIPADYQQVIQLGELGCILVVADGMGGQNAGEVASAIAVSVVQKMFSREELPDNICTQSSSIKRYLKSVVKAADDEVKAYSTEHPEAEGLGSTIVMAWIVGGKVYVCWLGDSRAYAFVPGKGISRLSRDHSYVQQLVDAGTFSEEEAMMHPNSNIVTRSLGDNTQKAKPEIMEYPLESGEVILLCSDGLCGVCKDVEISEIIEKNYADLRRCKYELTETALANGGSDNITIVLLHVCGDVDPTHDGSHSRKRKLWGVVAALAIALLALISLFFTNETVEKPKPFVRFAMRSVELVPNKILGFRVKSHNDDEYVFRCEDQRIKVVNRENSAIVSLYKNERYDSKEKIKLIVQLKADSMVSDTLDIVLKRKGGSSKTLIGAAKKIKTVNDGGKSESAGGKNSGVTGNNNGSGLTLVEGKGAPSIKKQ